MATKKGYISVVRQDLNHKTGFRLTPGQIYWQIIAVISGVEVVTVAEETSRESSQSSED